MFQQREDAIQKLTAGSGKKLLMSILYIHCVSKKSSPFFFTIPKSDFDQF